MFLIFFWFCIAELLSWYNVFAIAAVPRHLVTVYDEHSMSCHKNYISVWNICRSATYDESKYWEYFKLSQYEFLFFEQDWQIISVNIAIVLLNKASIVLCRVSISYRESVEFQFTESKFVSLCFVSGNKLAWGDLESCRLRKWYT